MVVFNVKGAIMAEDEILRLSERMVSIALNEEERTPVKAPETGQERPQPVQPVGKGITAKELQETQDTAAEIEKRARERSASAERAFYTMIHNKCSAALHDIFNSAGLTRAQIAEIHVADIADSWARSCKTAIVQALQKK
jgi:predicted Zn-dependent protease